MQVETEKGDIVIDNEGREWNAVRKFFNNPEMKDCARVEVWSEDFELMLGALPVDATPETIEAAFWFYTFGVATGKKAGHAEMQFQMRNLLGLN